MTEADIIQKSVHWFAEQGLIGDEASKIMIGRFAFPILKKY